MAKDETGKLVAQSRASLSLSDIYYSYLSHNFHNITDDILHSIQTVTTQNTILVYKDIKYII